MVPRLAAAAFAAALLTTGCATLRGGPEPGAELVGRTLRMETARGQVTRLSFRPGGEVRARFGRRTLDGRWQASRRRLCFRWPSAPRECWPYRQPFERGRTRTLTSDRGNVLRVTLL